MSTKTINYSGLQSLTLWKFMQLTIGLALIIFTLYQAANFPSFSNSILMIIFVIFVVQLFNRYAWLICLPISIVAFDFSAESGRFIFNELDFIILTMMAAALITHQIQHKFPINFTTATPFILTALALSSVTIADLWNGIGQPLIENPYYSTLYHFKVAKGFIYGLSLALLFYNQYQVNNSSVIKHLLWCDIILCYFWMIQSHNYSYVCLYFEYIRRLFNQSLVKVITSSVVKSQ